MKMKNLWLFVFFFGLSQANDCKHWKRSTTQEDQRRIGAMLFLVETSAMYKCSMRCYRTEDCAVFSYDQQTGNYTGFKTAISSNPGIAISTSGTFFFNDALYIVTIKTGTHQYASTNANVFLEMYGSFGSTGEIHLVDDTYNRRKFDRGKTDVFNITSIDIGTLQKIKISHDNSGSGPGWEVKTIIISEKGQSGITFAVNAWIAINRQLYKTIVAP